VGGLDHACDHFAKGAFAGTVGSQKRVDLSGVKRKADTIDGPRGEIFRQSVEDQHAVVSLLR